MNTPSDTVITISGPRATFTALRYILKRSDRTETSICLWIRTRLQIRTPNGDLQKPRNVDRKTAMSPSSGRAGSSLMAMMEASLDQRWRFRGNHPPHKQRKTLLTIMTSTFKWIVVHVLKSKLGYGRSWQTFSSAGRPCFCSCFFLRDSADNSIVAPELDYRGWRCLNEQEGQIKNAHIKGIKATKPGA